MTDPVPRSAGAVDPGSVRATPEEVDPGSVRATPEEVDPGAASATPAALDPRSTRATPDPVGQSARVDSVGLQASLGQAAGPARASRRAAGSRAHDVGDAAAGGRVGTVDRPLVLAVFGATGTVGGEVVRQALRNGDTVRAFVRNVARLPIRHERLQVVEGDPRDEAAIGRAIAGSDAVVDTLGPAPGTDWDIDTYAEAVRSMLGAMERHGVRRLVVLSGAAVDMPGERKPFVDALTSRLVRFAAGRVVEAKQRELEVVLRSPLDWIVVRPPRIEDGPLTGRYRAGRIALGPGARISRPDLAHFLLRQVREAAYIRDAPYVSG